MPWPEEALIEVAKKFLDKIELEESDKTKLANVAGYAHAMTQASSIKMETELKRVFYVTPTNFVELLKGFDKILGTKRKAVNEQIKKL